jgi:hypothetical protein
MLSWLPMATSVSSARRTRAIRIASIEHPVNYIRNAPGDNIDQQNIGAVAHPPISRGRRRETQR